MYFVCQELNNTIYGIKKRCNYWGAFRSRLRADNEISLNLWKAVNIEEYNRWDLKKSKRQTSEKGFTLIKTISQIIYGLKNLSDIEIISQISDVPKPLFSCQKHNLESILTDCIYLISYKIGKKELFVQDAR